MAVTVRVIETSGCLYLLFFSLSEWVDLSPFESLFVGHITAEGVKKRIPSLRRYVEKKRLKNTTLRDSTVLVK